MKLIIVALACLAIAAAAPVEKEVVQIIRSLFDQKPQGGYVYSFENSDGSAREEAGEIKEVLDEEKKPHAVVVVRGSFTYLDENKQSHTVEYIADENGFRATGADIPQVPARR